MRKVIIALALATALVAVAAASAALPHAGTRFNGTTSAKSVNGFGDDMTFLAGARSLKAFSFGTLGCFGYGSFPVGVDPYADSLAQFRTSIPVTAKGTFAVKSVVVSWNGGDAGTKLKVSVTGAFTSATSVKGTIAVVETAANGGSCGPSKMTFTAAPGKA